MTFDKIGAWAITEPDAGSDAFGGMRTTVRRDGDEWVLKGQKTFITNGPYADTMVVYAKHDTGGGHRPRATSRCSRSCSTPVWTGLDAEQAAAQDGHALLTHRPALLRRRPPR